MPYINSNRRKAFKSALGDLQAQIEGAGDLNYVISKLCKRYVQIREPITYSLLNEIIGVLESAKMELFRRMVAPYEDVKIQEHGDI
jgi:hypothetical protein